MYASPDLDVCIHECRVRAEDDIYVATLSAKSELRLLDLTEILLEEEVTEFESLDIAVHMLFLANEHAYPIAREIAKVVHKAGFDGIIYPSYFSLLRTGAMPSIPPTVCHYDVSGRSRRTKKLRRSQISLFLAVR